MTPFPTQLSGAHFLASNRYALLADEPRVGKTGTAIIAADYIMAANILVITTASGRGVWKRGFADWSVFDRSIEIALPTSTPTKNVVIVGWPSVANPQLRAALVQRSWDLVILDESHYAKSITAKRTQAVYGSFLDDGSILAMRGALANTGSPVWCLTGTPIPHAPNDLYPMLRFMSEGRLLANDNKQWPNVTSYSDFLHRYCVVRMKKISNFNRIPVVIGGRNLPELRERMSGLMLLRTQEDVGIRPPVYDLLPLVVSEKLRRMVDGAGTDEALAAALGLTATPFIDKKLVLEAARKGDTKTLEMHLGPLRRITGEIKAEAVVDAVRDEFECGLDKIVLAYWHRDVGKILLDGLAKHGVVGIDGSTPAAKRDEAVAAFADPKGPRVFLGQIEAAGESIDLSAAAVLWFVETSFSPKSMKQMSLRITNHGQKRQAVVKVCALEGSIDEALQASLLRLWTAIREVLKS